LSIEEEERRVTIDKMKTQRERLEATLNLRHRLTCVLITSCMGCEFVHDNIWSLWNFREDIDIDFAEAKV